MKFTRSGFVVIAMTLIGAASLYVWQARGNSVVRYALPEKSTWWIAPSMLAGKWKMFQAERVTVDDEYWATGRRALEAFFQGRGDIAYSAGPPVVSSLVDGKSVIVLARAMSSSRIILSSRIVITSTTG